MASFIEQLLGSVNKGTQIGNSMFGIGEGEEIPVTAAPQRKGIFGIKGQARDLLGLLGDAFLIQGGADPIYSKRKEEERIADSLMDYGTDPQGAIGQLAGTPGGAEQARKMQENLWKMLNDKGTLANTIRKTDSEIEENNLAKEKQVISTVAAMMNAAKKDKTSWLAMRDFAIKYAGGKKVELPWNIPDDPDGEFIYRGVDPEAAARLEDTRTYRDAQLGVEREKVAETKRSNRAEEANKAIETYVKATGTAAEAAERLDRVVEQDRSKGSRGGRPIPKQIKVKEGQTVWKDGKKYVIQNGRPVEAR